MSITEIETAITPLPSEQVDTLLAWLEEYHATLWDAQIARDLDAGRLDALINEVETELAADLAKPL